jgi:hypothetical protein
MWFAEPISLHIGRETVRFRAAVSHISQKTSEIWGTHDRLQVKILKEA